VATFDAWLDAYGEAYDGLPGRSDLPCPNCGYRTLRLVFTARAGRPAGYAAFWCDTCLEGIHISRTAVPEGAVVRDGDAAPPDRVPHIPDFRSVN
jgi:hypothetical protein